jgi:hypothetical protein
MTEWGRRRITGRVVRRALQLFPPGTRIHRVIVGSTLGLLIPLLAVAVGILGTQLLGDFIVLPRLQGDGWASAKLLIGGAPLLPLLWGALSGGVGAVGGQLVNRYRTVVVTDGNVYLFACGRWLLTPRRLLGVFPPTTAQLPPRRHLLGRVAIGGHRLYVTRTWYDQVVTVE